MWRAGPVASSLSNEESIIVAAPYEISWNLASKRLTFKLRGSWDVKTMSEWERAYRAAVAQAPAGGWTVLGDMIDYPPQTEEVQKGHEPMMALSVKSGMTRAALVIPKVVTTMQNKRSAAKSKADDVIVFVTSLAEAARALTTVRV